MKVSRLTDFVYAFRLLNLIQKPWKEQEAFRLGIVDENGVALKKWSDLRTPEEKDNYTYFHRLAFNMKRMLERVPGFDKRIVKMAAALRLLKESEDVLGMDRQFTDEEIQFIGQSLLEDTPTNVTGAAVSTDVPKPLAKKGSKMIKRKPLEVKKPDIKTMV